jgi:hypothetical protein
MSTLIFVRPVFFVRHLFKFSEDEGALQLSGQRFECLIQLGKQLFQLLQWGEHPIVPAKGFDL